MYEKNKALQIIDTPFEKIVETSVSTLRDLKPNSQEKAIIDESVTDKYIPAVRNAVFLALAATPGILMMGDPSAIWPILAVISSVTGIAWFTMSLKEVKEKFATFGVELTSDMLQAFLATVFIAAVISGYSIASPQVQAVITWAQEEGLEITNIINSKIFRAGASLASIGAGAQIIRKLVASVIKFDANDAMLTGSSDVAKKFFERSLSSLRDTAQTLKGEHSLESANFEIATALSYYYGFFVEIGTTPPKELNEKTLKKLAISTTKSQEVVDKIVIPLIISLIKQYEPFVKDNEALNHKYKFIIQALDKLQTMYEENEQPSQGLADTTIAHGLNTLAEFLEQFQDELES